jgi:hypothetical protein
VFLRSILAQNFKATLPLPTSLKQNPKEKKSKKPEPANPCSLGKHNPLVFHPIWQCFKLPLEERESLQPKDLKAHTTLANDLENKRDEGIVKASAYLSNALEAKKDPVLNSGASHNMVNDL